MEKIGTPINTSLLQLLLLFNNFSREKFGEKKGNGSNLYGTVVLAVGPFPILIYSLNIF